MPVRALEELQLGFADRPGRAVGRREYLLRGPYPPPPVAGAPAALLETGRRSVDAVFNARDFFPTFYRKVMHNIPLDLCACEAGRVATTLAPSGAGWILGAHEGGELRLLLTSAVAESASPTERPTPQMRGPQPISSRSVKRATPPRNGGIAVRGGASLPVRTTRIAAELRSLAGQIAEDHRHEIESAVSRAGSASFDAEDHGVMAAVDACRQIAESAAVVGAAGKAARALTEIEALGSPEVPKPAIRLTNVWLTEPDHAGNQAGDRASTRALRWSWDARTG